MSASCVATVGHHGSYVAVAPPLPVTVELVDPDSYYTYGGFYYYYHGDRWYYSSSKSGRRIDLPARHYPKKLRFKGKRRVRVWKEKRSTLNERDKRYYGSRARGTERQHDRAEINERKQKGLKGPVQRKKANNTVRNIQGNRSNDGKRVQGKELNNTVRNERRSRVDDRATVYEKDQRNNRRAIGRHSQ